MVVVKIDVTSSWLVGFVVVHGISTFDMVTVFVMVSGPAGTSSVVPWWGSAEVPVAVTLSTPE